MSTDSVELPYDLLPPLEPTFQERLEDLEDAAALHDAELLEAPPALEAQEPVAPLTPMAPPKEDIHEAEPLPELDGELDVLDEMLRHRRRLLERIERGQNLVAIARTSALVILAAAAAFGFSIGMFRGGIQSVYAAIKLPIVLTLTACLTAPVYTAMRRSMGYKVSLQQDLALCLSAVALGVLVTGGLAPVFYLAIRAEIGYHAAILLAVGLCGLGGVVGYAHFFQGMHDRVHLESERQILAVVVLGVMALVSTQLVWVFRPYLVRPQTQEVPIVRSLEGSFLEAIRGSSDSARGIYRLPRKFKGPSGGSR